MLSEITPIVLTYNEEPNLARTLAALRWAREVVIVDSGSSDRTLEIARSFPNVRTVTRAFDSHARQWNFAIEASGRDARWLLALDADYVLSDALVAELARLAPAVGVSAYRARFRYAIDGSLLRGTLYPPVSVLFRKERARYVQDGHTQRLVIEHGSVEMLAAPIVHDDRKSLARWLASQERYAAAEAQKIAAGSWRSLRWPDRVRKVPFAAAPLVLAQCLLLKGGLLDGRAGAKYAAQRTLAELLITLKLLER